MRARALAGLLATFALLCVLAGFVTPAAAQTTYTFNKNSGSWATANNWTPSRSSPASTDILVFNGTTTPSVSVTAVPQQTIGRLRFINNVVATMGSSANVTLTIGSATSPALEIAQGSTVTVSSSNTINMAIGNSAQAQIAGSLTFAGAAHQLTSSVASAIQFTSTGSFTTGTSFSGSPFGTSGTANVVVFNSGATYTNTVGNGPWGLTQPSSKVVFNAGSKQVWRATAGFQATGRTFANLFVQNNTTLAAAATSSFTVDTLNIESGSSFTISGSSAAAINITGDLLAAGTGGVSLTPGTGGIQFNGGRVQNIAGGGSGTITLVGSPTISATSTVAAARTLTFTTGGMVVNGTFRLNNGGAVTGGSNWTYGATGTLEFAQTSAYSVPSTATFWPAASGPPNVIVGASGITMNVARTVSGTLTDNGPITSANLLTITGTFRRNTGGSVAAAPVYSGSASTLLYGNALTVGTEWGSGSVVGAGVPSNVTIASGAGNTVAMPSSDRTVPGNLTITSGTLALNATSGNLSIGGNWSDAGTFTSNGRTVTFTGAGTQTLSRTGGEAFTTLVLNKSGGSVQLGSAVTCTPAGSAQALTMNGSVDVLNLNGQTLTLNGPVGGTDAAGTLTGSATSGLALASTLGGSAGTLRFTSGAQSLGTLSLNLTGASPTVTLGTPLTVNTTLTLTSGVVTAGANVLTVGASGTVTRTSGWVNGQLRRRAATGAPSVTYNIGSATVYAPVTLAFTNVTVAGDVGVSTTAGDHPSVATSGLDATQSVNEYWSLVNAGTTYGSVNATFTFTAGLLDAGVVTDSLEGRLFAASAWTTTPPVVGTRTATTTTLNGLTTLGDVALGLPRVWTITSSAGAHGTIAPLGATQVKDHRSIAYAITPDEGYNIQNLVVDGSTLPAASSYTFTNVTANHTITANFTIKFFNVTLVANGFGDLTPDHPGPYPYHDIIIITATPRLGNHFVDMQCDQVYSTVTPSYFAVDSNLVITGNFARDPMQYTRTSVGGAYSQISTASGATRLISTADDSTVSVKLPFPFTFSGVVYSANNYLSVNANGFAYFSRTNDLASSPTLAQNSNLYNQSTPNSVLAPWWDDLSVNAVGTNPAGSVLYQTQGASGSRTFTVQWTNVSSNNTTAGGQPRRVNFQLVLFEASQAIEFRYGTVSGLTYSNLESASIGVEDSLGGTTMFIDGATGSRITSNGMLTTNRWPSRFIRFTPGVPTPLLGTYNVGAGQTYVSLTDAVADVNQRGVSGPVTFNLTDAVYDTSAAGGSNLFPVLLGPVAGVSAGTPITIQAASNARISSRGAEAGNCGTASLATAIGTGNEPVFGLIGCDFVTLKNLTITGGNLADRGLLLLPASLTDGCQYNTFQSIGVQLNRANTSSIAIQSTVGSTPSSFNGTNSYNRFVNLNVQNCYAGVSLAGNANLFDDGNVISVQDGQTVIGAGVGDIGGGAPSTFGIRAGNQSNATITFCNVTGMTGTSTGTVDGIVLDNLASSSLSSGTCTIANNNVNSLSSSATNGGRVTGIRVNLTSAAGSVSHVFNNFVSGLNSASTVTVSRRVVGIMVQDAGSGAGAEHDVDFNSIRLQPANVACTNACFEAASSAPVVRLRDNALANVTGTQASGAKHYVIVAPAAGTLGAAGSLSDYNVVHVATATNGYVGFAGGDRALLSDWQSAMAGHDAHSLTGDPGFVSSSNLHINASLPTPVAQAGSYFDGDLSWVSSDIDFQAREENPDIGADEGVFQVLTTKDVAVSSLVDPFDGATKSVSTPFSPQAMFANTGTSAQSNIPVRYQIRGPLPATTLVYDQAATIASLAPGASQTVTFAAATIAVSGPYQLTALTQLAGDLNSQNDTKTGSLDVSGPLSGTYSVGSGQFYPFNTLTSAIARLNATGVSGPVVFQLTSSSYSAGETFPIQINAIPGASASNTFTLRPAAGVTTTIAGATTRAPIVLNGADWVTIDGSNTPGLTRRDLTIQNTSNSNVAAVVWGQTTSGGDPATHDVIKNVIALGDDRLTTLIGIGFGGSTIALNSNGVGNVANRVQNCDVRKAQYGIYSAGASAANKNTGTVITSNTCDNNVFEAPGQGGILVRFEDGISIDHNRIGSISTSTGSDVFAISLGLLNIGSDSQAGDEVTNATVSHNTILGVAQTNPTGYGAAGIAVATAASGITTIVNNMVTGVTSPAFDPDVTAGILLGGGAATTRVYFNSVAMTGSRANSAAGSFCLAIGGTNPVVDVRDNVFFTNQTTSGPGDSYLIGLDYSTYTNLTCDYNDMFGFTGLFAITAGLTNSPDGDVPTFANWKSLTGKDAHSLNVDPQFVSAQTNLHVSSVNSPVVRAGIPIAGITDDIDGDAGLRTTQPVMGCDEFVTYTITTSQNGSGSVAKSPDLAGYVSGSVVQMQAFPSGHWHFISWNGDLAGTVNPQNITVNSNKTIGATFAIDSLPVVVTASTGGTGAASPAGSPLPYGTPISFTATAATGYHFVTWSGDTTTTLNPYSTVLARARTLEADFAINTYTLTATGDAHGTVTRTPSQATYDHGTTVTLTPVPQAGYHFVAWGGDTTGSVAPLAVVVTRNRAITATFALNQSTLAVATSGSGTAGASPVQATYDWGTPVTLSATPATGWHFTGWSGDTTAATNPMTFPIGRDMSVTANFVVNTYAVSVSSLGSGTAAVAPVQPSFAHGTTATFTATPEAGQSFLGWAGDTTASDNPLVMPVTRPLALVARFTAAVNVTIVGNGTVSKEPDQTANPLGSAVLLTATPETGWHFVTWTGDTTTTTNPLSLPVTTTRNVTANFALNEYTVSTAAIGDGTVGVSPQQATYPHGSVVRFTATPGAGNAFVAWSGALASAAPVDSITITANASVTGAFTYKVDVTTSGPGGVATVPSPPRTAPGGTVQLTAQPQAFCSFTGWTGDTTAAANPLTLGLAANRALTANFTVDRYPLAVPVVGSGSVAKTPDQATYEHGTPVTLDATPAFGWHLAGWSGDTTATGSPLVLPMTSARSVTATFVLNEYTLALGSTGSGTAVASPAQVTYSHGTPVTLTATAGAHYSFAGWVGDTTAATNPLSIVMTEDRTIQAVFTPDEYPITTDPDGNGSVTRAPDLATYPYGSTLTLTAVPATGWHFNGWTGDTATVTNPLTFTVTGPRTFTPSFGIDSYPLTVNVTGSGAVAKDPDLAQYPYNTTVDLTATPGVGFKFVNWTGGASGTSPTTQLIVDAPKTVTAVFDSADYTVQATASGPGSVAYDPVRPTYRYPALVTFTATPSAHAHFIGWTGDTTSSANPLTLVMTSNRSLTAVFGIDSFAVAVGSGGNGTAAASPSQALYPYGTPISVVATPATGFTFASWSGDTTAATNPLPIVVTRDRTFTALFDTLYYTVTANTSGPGTVVRDPNRAQYPAFSTVELAPVPAVGAVFTGWSGDTTTSAQGLTLTMTRNRNVTANFASTALTLTVNVTGPGTVTKTPNQATYTTGQAVKLTASVTDTAFHFRRWGGAADGIKDTVTVIMNGNTTVSAQFISNLYPVNVTIAGSGSVTRNPNQATMYKGGVMTLTAIPANGFQFQGWSGDYVGVYNPAYLSADSAITLVATFVAAPPPVLNITVNGQGTVAKNPNQASYPAGSIVNIVAHAAVDYHFVGWSGDVNLLPDTSVFVMMDRDHSITATFAPNGFQLTTSVFGTGSVTRTPDLPQYASGTAVQVTAVPGAGSHFVDWVGDTAATTSPLSLVITRDRTLQARFGHTLTSTATAQGKVLMAPAGGTYVKNTVVTLTPRAAEGWHFVGWSGDTTGTSTSLAVVMSRDKSITALWAVDKYRLSVRALEGGTAAKSPDSTAYTAGTHVTIMATPEPGWHFAGWLQEALDMENAQDPHVCEPCQNPMLNPLVIEMNSTRNIVAQFEQDGTTLQLVTTGNGHIVATYTPQEGPDSTVTLVAEPDAGWSFAGWQGDASGAVNPLVMKLAGPTTVKAVFVAATGTLAAPVVAPTLSLAAVTPNPVVGRARVAFTLARDAHVTLDVIDVQGRQVTCLLDGHRSAGRHELAWTAASTASRTGAGVYFVRLRTPEGTLVRRFSVTR